MTVLSLDQKFLQNYSEPKVSFGCSQQAFMYLSKAMSPVDGSQRQRFSQAGIVIIEVLNSVHSVGQGLRTQTWVCDPPDISMRQNDLGPLLMTPVCPGSPSHKGTILNSIVLTLIIVKLSRKCFFVYILHHKYDLEFPRSGLTIATQKRKYLLYLQFNFQIFIEWKHLYTLPFA